MNLPSVREWIRKSLNDYKEERSRIKSYKRARKLGHEVKYAPEVICPPDNPECDRSFVGLHSGNVKYVISYDNRGWEKYRLYDGRAVILKGRDVNDDN